MYELSKSHLNPEQTYELKKHHVNLEQGYELIRDE